MAFKIKTLNNISQQGIRLFGDNYLLNSESVSPEAIIVRSAQVDTDAYDGLLAVARAGAGVNNISIEKATQKGVCVFNTPGANANAVAELVFIMLGIAARKIHKSLEFTQKLSEESDEKVLSEKVEKGKSTYTGFELAGKTLGVLGLGKIGVLVANAGIEHGMKVIGYDAFPTIANIHNLNARVEIAHTLDLFIGQADIITVHVPLSDKTRNLINESVISRMKPGVILLNYSRKGIYDDDAVIRGLESGKVSTYLTDFPTRQMVKTPNVVCTPHLGASTAESEENCAVMAVTQLKSYLEYGVITNSVNFPIIEVYPQQTTKTRLIVINKDLPNMIAHITNVLGNAGINIQSLTNESNGKVGYNIIDFESDIQPSVISSIQGIPDVLRVRVLRF